MQLEKQDHKSGLGIYAECVRVETKEQWEAAKKVARDMIVWLDESNGTFKGNHSTAFAIAHSQVALVEKPWQLFVVDKKLVAPNKIEKNSKETMENTYFEGQAIFNVEILEAKEEIEKEVPRRQVTRDKKNKTQVEVEMVMEKRNVSNVLNVPEACMSFPHRKQKNMDRYYEIKVRYQYLSAKKGKEKIATFEGTVTGLKAHILQHESGHFNAQNIYFSK